VKNFVHFAHVSSVRVSHPPHVNIGSSKFLSSELRSGLVTSIMYPA